MCEPTEEGPKRMTAERALKLWRNRLTTRVAVLTIASFAQ
jgi:hypothetical protein